MVKKKSRLVRTLVLAGAGALAIGGAVFAVTSRQAAEVAKKVNARKVKVEIKDVRKQLDITGKVLPQSSAAVYSPVSGQLKQLYVEEGARVKARDNLFAVLQDTAGQSELESRRNELNKARLELRAAEDNIERRRSVKDLFSDTENQRAENEYQRAKLEFEAARQRLSLLEDTLGLDTPASAVKPPRAEGPLSLIYVRAPRDGVVTFVNKSVGESVLATTEMAEATGREVLTLSDLDRLIVRSRILEADLASVKAGTEVSVKLDAYPDKRYKGRVSRISQQGIEDKNGGYTYFVTDVLIENPDADVRAQMNASIEILVAEKKGVLALPANAVATLNGFSVVEVPGTDPLRPVYKPVKTGLATDTFVEIAQGTLKPGDEVLEIDFSKLDLKLLAQGKLGKGNVN